MPGEFDEPTDGVPLRLYLKLEQGHVADLFAVTQATAAFAAGVKELAYILDPSLQLYIGLAPSTRGSLWENTILKAVNDPTKRKELYLLAGSALLWFMTPPAERLRDNIWEPYLDKYLPTHDQVERQKAKREMQRAASGNVAEREHRETFRALDRDKGIEAVGVSIERKTPLALIPQSEFRIRAGFPDVIPADQDRVTQEEVRATLIRPVLDGNPRRWKFSTTRGDLTATMRDTKFLEAVVGGRTGVPLRAGIEMDLLLEVRERYTDGVWQIVDRTIIEVLGIHAPPSERQGSIFSE
jgi:hypothetical protein